MLFRSETHISTLLLAGEFAYKLRKPIALPFLDFTTLAARAHDCEEELRLNRRTAPQLYLDVRPVRGTLAQPRIGEPDESVGAIDWLLRMHRFDNELLLDRLAARGALTEADVDALARRVADFHAALPASPAAFGDPAGVLAWARACTDQRAPASAAVLAALAVAVLGTVALAQDKKDEPKKDLEPIPVIDLKLTEPVEVTDPTGAGAGRCVGAGTGAGAG